MDARKTQGNAEFSRLSDEDSEWIHSGVMTKQCAEKLGGVMAFEPGTTPGEKTVGSGMGFVEGVAAKTLQVLPQFSGVGGTEAIADTLGDELITESSQLFVIFRSDRFQQGSS